MKQTSFISVEVAEDNSLTVKTSADLTFPDALNILYTLQLNYMNQTLAQAPEDLHEKVKEEVYDMVNAAASNILVMFAPELELRPDLTAEAILQAENKILDEVE